MRIITRRSVVGLGQVQHSQYVVMMYSTHMLLGCHLCVLGVVIAHDGIATREKITAVTHTIQALLEIMSNIPWQWQQTTGCLWWLRIFKHREE